jgi:NADH-quinone oxidoreductase subunit J
MGVASLIFWIFAVAAVAGGLGVILSREPIWNVLSLVLVMLSLAIEFLLLSAQFVFAVQVIVYAGAVMVLFLFVVFLLGPVREIAHFRSSWWQIFVAAVVVGSFAGLIYFLLNNLPFRQPDPGDTTLLGTVQAIGAGLFTTYLYPFELTSILLLVAAVGAIYLSRREPGEAPRASSGETPEVSRGADR